MDIGNSLSTAYETTLEEGLPQLQEEALKQIPNQSVRNGKLPPNQQSEDHVHFSVSKQIGDCWHTTAQIHGSSWELLDYGDVLPWSSVSQELVDDLCATDCERNQCLVTHLAAGLHGNNLRKEGKSLAANEFCEI